MRTLIVSPGCQLLQCRRYAKANRTFAGRPKLGRKVLEVQLPGLVALFVLAVSLTGIAGAAAAGRDLSAFSDQSYIYIATVRKDGNQSTAVPVWFVTTSDGRILIDTNSDSWKARRIRRGSPVIVWLGKRDGPAFLGKAEIVDDGAVHDQMIERIPEKYFLARIGFFGPSRAKFASGKIVTIRITPERDLPEGFQSQPGTPAPQGGNGKGSCAWQLSNLAQPFGEGLAALDFQL